MKYFVASDIHGSAHYCELMLRCFRESGADTLLLLGDILYHGPRNDLPEKYSPKQVIELLNPLKDRIYAVRGNCEAEVDQMVLSFPVMADYALIALGGRRVFMTHGHLFDESRLPALSSGDAILHGHTHLPVAELIEGEELSFYHLNPGSVSLPKGGNPNSYGILDESGFKIHELDGRIIKEISFT